MHNVYPLLATWLSVFASFIATGIVYGPPLTFWTLLILFVFGMAIDFDRFFSPTYIRYRQASKGDAARAATAAGLGLPRSLPHARPCFHHLGGLALIGWVLFKLSLVGGLSFGVATALFLLAIMMAFAHTVAFPEMRRAWAAHGWDITPGAADYALVLVGCVLASLVAGTVIALFAPSPLAALIGAQGVTMNWIWKHLFLKSNNQWLYPLPGLKELRARDVPGCGLFPVQ